MNLWEALRIYGEMLRNEAVLRVREKKALRVKAKKLSSLKEELSSLAEKKTLEAGLFYLRGRTKELDGEVEALKSFQGTPLPPSPAAPGILSP